MRTSYLALVTLLFASQVYGNLLDGLEHHGDHGDHQGEHGEHAHGEHPHGDHEEHAHGDHGEHAEGDHAHGEQAHGDHGEHAHGEEHHHHQENTAAVQDSFATALASDLGGGFLSNLPAANSAPAPAETFVAPAETFVAPAAAPAETFVAPGPALVANFAAPLTTEATESFITPTPANEKFVEEEQQQFVQENSIQFTEKEESPAPSSSGEAKQLATSNVNGGGSTGEYPEYATVPQTSFSCAAQETGGYFADPEAQCQVFHICLNSQNLGSFLCPNGTLFHQQYFVCDWWFNVDCGSASQSYGLNAKIGVVPDSE